MGPAMVRFGRTEGVDPVEKPPLGLAMPDLIEQRFELRLQVWSIRAPRLVRSADFDAADFDMANASYGLGMSRT